MKIKSTPPVDFQDGIDIYNCTFEENTKFKEKVDIKDNGNSNNAKCNSIYIFHKNAAFLDGFYIKNFNTLEVFGDLYVINTLEVANHATIKVHGNLYVQNTKIKNNANIDITGKTCKVTNMNDILSSCEEEIQL
ncbi:hypothetical protein [Oceanobacillus rekensis]|uniref:hypothetical protein n=1 Tax=Oceanobacillus rekensis TaxID=937927 RepID=UPI0011211497|nr:hypothetical protein [Oceanobacillus rekensis]